jgi:hypothetical protein
LARSGVGVGVVEGPGQPKLSGRRWPRGQNRRQAASRPATESESETGPPRNVKTKPPGLRPHGQPDCRRPDSPAPQPQENQRIGGRRAAAAAGRGQSRLPAGRVRGEGPGTQRRARRLCRESGRGAKAGLLPEREDARAGGPALPKGPATITPVRQERRPRCHRRGGTTQQRPGRRLGTRPCGRYSFPRRGPRPLMHAPAHTLPHWPGPARRRPSCMRWYRFAPRAAAPSTQSPFFGSAASRSACCTRRQCSGAPAPEEGAAARRPHSLAQLAFQPARPPGGRHRAPPAPLHPHQLTLHRAAASWQPRELAAAATLLPHPTHAVAAPSDPPLLTIAFLPPCGGLSPLAHATARRAPLGPSAARR